MRRFSFHRGGPERQFSIHSRDGGRCCCREHLIPSYGRQHPPGLLATLGFAALLSQVSPAQTITDDFTDPSNWGTPFTTPGKNISVGSGRMNYTSTTTGGDGAGIARNAPILPTTQNWSIKVDVHVDPFTIMALDQGTSVFLGVGKTGDWLNTQVILGFDRDWWYPDYYGVNDDVKCNGVDAPRLFNVNYLPSPDAALRMDYDAANPTITYYCDTNGATGGYNWVVLGTANISSGAYNLHLSPSDTFTIILAGWSELQVVAAGQAYLSNLEISEAKYAFTNFAGMPGASGTNDGIGSAARFYGPTRPATDSSGNLYLADAYNHTIRKITPAGVVTTLAGLAGVSGTNDGTGSLARFNQPHAVGLDPNGNIFVPDWGSHTIRKVTPAGVVTTLAGSPGNPGWVDAAGSTARFKTPECVAVDTNGNVFVAERDNFTIRQVTAAGVVTTLAGSPGTRGWADGTGSAALFNDPSGIALDSAGNMFVGDRGNDAIRKVTPTGLVTTLAGSPGNSGWVDGRGSAARFYRPSGVVVDKLGNLFVTEERNHTIRKVTALGEVTTIGGLALTTGTNDGVGSDARFNTPAGAAMDGSGVLYVADASNYRISRGTPGAVQTSVLLVPFTYTTNNGAITITSYNGSGSAASIPSTISGLPVTSIGDSAFFYRTSLTSVTIPNSVTNIGEFAFGACTSLTNITIPASVTSIGNGAFSGCSSLPAIMVDASNSSYRSVDGVLFDKNQTLLIQCPGGKRGSYIVPSSVTSIRDNAFFVCINLTNVMIPNSVTNIGFAAFSSCPSLTSVTLPGSVTSIGDYVFNWCTSLASVTIPNSVTNIGYAAFQSCESLTSVTIGNGVISIGGQAFSGCTSLTNVTLPASVTNIGNGAFSYCFSFTSITLPSGITHIGSGTFSDCSSLTNVTIPNSVTRIGTNAFNYCTSLTNVTIPNSVASIEDGAFANCTSLASVTLPDSVTGIGGYAFYDCSSLTGVTIGNSVTSIGDWAFGYCSNLAGVYFQGNAPSLVGFGVFDGDSKAIIYYLPGTTGWGPTFAGRPTALWRPQIQIGGNSFGVPTNQFGFNINWASGQAIVVEACTNLASPTWSPLQTNTLSSDSFYFSDSQWTNYPTHFYRIRWP
jgi:hypothetical protein